MRSDASRPHRLDPHRGRTETEKKSGVGSSGWLLGVFVPLVPFFSGRGGGVPSLGWHRQVCGASLAHGTKSAAALHCGVRSGGMALQARPIGPGAAAAICCGSVPREGNHPKGEYCTCSSRSVVAGTTTTGKHRPAAGPLPAMSGGIYLTRPHLRGPLHRAMPRPTRRASKGAANPAQ